MDERSAHEPKEARAEEAHDAGEVVPYEGRAIYGTHPNAMAFAAALRGLRPAPIESCRVLELGSGAGANLLAMAFHLPEARFVGVEPSARHHREARERRDALGLSNVELVHADVAELDDGLGEFDYVVAHGLLSWVAAPAREAIFDRIERLLAPGGVAYVSYNTPSGWAVRGELRRLLLSVAAGAGGPRELLRAARSALDRLASAAPPPESFYESVWQHELALARAKSDHDLVQDLLAEHNQPLDVRDVVRMARARGLEYLDELAPAMADARKELAIRAGLARSGDDPIEAEALSDYLLFRRIRATLFCRERALSAATPREPADVLAGAWIATSLRPASARTSLEPGVNEIFVDGDGARLGVTSAPLKAALLVLADAWPRAPSVASVIERSAELLVRRRMLPDGASLEEAERRALLDDLLALSRLRRLEVRLHPVEAAPASDRPRVSTLTRMEVERGPWVTTPYHHALELDPLARALVRHLDGERGKRELALCIAADLEAGRAALGEPGGGEADPSERLPEAIDKTLDALAHAALLRAG